VCDNHTTVLASDYPGQTCSIARSLELVGERWTLLIVRDIFRRKRRFEDLQESLGIARNVLSARLAALVDEGIVERRIYQERPERYEYFLTEKGLDLWPVLVALIGWGDRYQLEPGGPPAVIVHKDCGGRVNDRRICERCDEELEVRDAVMLEGEAAESYLQPA
jgi:DNA-binding HxlR family transcriptional regulator